MLGFFLLLSSVMCLLKGPLNRCRINVFPILNKEFLAVQLWAKQAKISIVKNPKERKTTSSLNRLESVLGRDPKCPFGNVRIGRLQRLVWFSGWKEKKVRLSPDEGTSWTCSKAITNLFLSWFMTSLLPHPFLYPHVKPLSL